MGVTGIIVIIVVCAIATFFLYGIWAVENDNDNFRKKHGYKPKYHKREENDNQGDGDN